MKINGELEEVLSKDSPTCMTRKRVTKKGVGEEIDGASTNHDFTIVRGIVEVEEDKKHYTTRKSVGHLFSLLSGRTTYTASLLVGDLIISPRPSTCTREKNTRLVRQMNREMGKEKRARGEEKNRREGKYKNCIIV